jgi:cell division protein FtsA
MSSISQTKSTKTKYTVGLDIGTTKICAIIASKNEQGIINILGIGITQSEGLNRGVVTNIDRTVKAIKTAVEQAEQQSGLKIEEVYAGIAGDHVESFMTRGIVSISNSQQEVAKEDVDRLLEETRKVRISSDRRIMHTIPQDFIVDGQDGISDPIGMSGIRLESEVYIVTGMESALKNIQRCIERAGLRLKEIVLEPIAASCAVLTDDEKEVGVALVDIGGGTTDIAIFENNVIRFTSVFAIAGKQVTDDVRTGLGIVSEQAERVKREYGHSWADSIFKDELFMIPGIGGRSPMEISKSQLCSVIQPRMEEVFEFAYNKIMESNYASRLGAGVVITGGTTLLRGSDELARSIFKMPVKIGIPVGISNMGLAPEIENPVYATSVGLVMYGIEKGESKTLQPLNVPESQPEVQEQTPQEQIPVKKKVSFVDRAKKFLEEL